MTGTKKIRGLLDEGRRLLQAGEPREAGLAFGRVLLIAPTDADARAGLEDARSATAEAERAVEEKLGRAERALVAGQAGLGRSLLEEVLTGGGDRHRALALLERFDPRGGHLGESAPPLAAKEQAAVASGPDRSWSRRAFVASWVCAFAVLGTTVTSSWDAWLARLARTPSPRSAAFRPAASGSAPAPGERSVARARRLMEVGDAAGALAVLDTVPPEEPAYPFARQLRVQAIKAIQAGRPVP